MVEEKSHVSNRGTSTNLAVQSHDANALVMKSPPMDVRDVVTYVARRGWRNLRVTQLSTCSGVDAETAHDVRVSARRLACDIRTLHLVRGSSVWCDVLKDLKWIGNELGKLRDLDVLKELVELHFARDSNSHSDVMRRISTLRSERLVVVQGRLMSSRYQHLLTELHRLSHDPRITSRAKVDPREVFAPALWKVSCTLLYVVGDPTMHRRDIDIHLVRLATKKCRYAFELASECMPGEFENVASSLKGMQETLGQMNDRSTAVGSLGFLECAEESARELQQALRREVNALNPQWIVNFEGARQQLLDFFSRPMFAKAREK